MEPQTTSIAAGSMLQGVVLERGLFANKFKVVLRGTIVILRSVSGLKSYLNSFLALQLDVSETHINLKNSSSIFQQNLQNIRSNTERLKKQLNFLKGTTLVAVNFELQRVKNRYKIKYMPT